MPSGGFHFSSEPIRDGFEELLLQYVEELPGKTQKLLEASKAFDDQALANELHQLAGSLGLYGYRRCEGKCRGLLARLHEGQGALDIDADLRALIDDLNQVRARPAL